jgi:hypothetical protein
MLQIGDHFFPILNSELPLPAGGRGRGSIPLPYQLVRSDLLLKVSVVKVMLRARINIQRLYSKRNVGYGTPMQEQNTTSPYLIVDECFPNYSKMEQPVGI